MPYTFGPDALLFKWQPLAQIKIDSLGCILHKRHLSPTSVVEQAKDPTTRSFIVSGIRNDKVTGNSRSVTTTLKNLCRQGGFDLPDQLKKAIPTLPCHFNFKQVI